MTQDRDVSSRLSDAHVCNTPGCSCQFGQVHKVTCPPEWIKVGPSTEDTWSFDFYLAGIIAEGVEMIAKRGIGYPGKLDSQEEWTAILEEMALGFRNYCVADNCERTPELERSLALLAEWWGALWD